LSGEISKEGIANLHWKKNAEPDLYGYRVYRANAAGEEFVQVSRKPVTDTTFTDTLEVKTLAKFVFYKLVALDKHFNPSGFSDFLELKRPDVIPPAPPSFTEVVSKTNGVYLVWNASPSEDVIRHELYRTEAGKEEWLQLSVFADTTTRYTDISANAGSVYSYKVRAVDRGDLRTDSRPISAKKLDSGLRPGVASFRATADRSNQQIILRWTYKETGVESFLLYRAEPGKPMRLYQTLDGKQTELTDTDLFINTLYQYRIKAVFKDGSESAFSKALEMDY
jgi:fibronectin type 3 domain-containing protein